MLRQKPDRRETRTAEKGKGTIFFKKNLPQSVAEQEKIHILAP